jgi:hypothetical protein
MHFKIAFVVTGAAVAFAICSALGEKIPYEVALAGLLTVLTYWSKAPEPSRHQPIRDGGLNDGE